MKNTFAIPDQQAARTPLLHNLLGAVIARKRIDLLGDPSLPSPPDAAASTHG